MAHPIKICYAASEFAPFAKTGGLADVGGALPHRLHRRGYDVRCFMPLYGTLKGLSEAPRPVDFARDLEVRLGGRSYRVSLFTAPFPGTDLSIYFVDCPELYHRPSLYTKDDDEAERFGLFCRAVFEGCQRMGWSPDLIHAHDWHTALMPLLRRTVYDWDALFRRTRCLLTIHNIGYQGVFPADRIERLGLGDWSRQFDQNDLGAGRINLLRTGLIYADVLTTVSPTYAREIQTPEYGMGLDDLLRVRAARLTGILNGVDYEAWSPERDSHIPHRYSASRLQGKLRNKRHLLKEMGLSEDPRAPLVGIVSRLTEQKGFDLCFPVLPEMLDATPARLVVLGSGDERYERFFGWLQQRHPGRAVFYRGYNEELAHLIEAGADLFLMPSRYEPCGLNQMFSLRYGTLPLVRKTGGLADSVEPFDGRPDHGTGFVFEHYTPEGLRWALGLALRTWEDRETWGRLVQRAMTRDFSWERQTDRYEELYRWLLRA